jgi:hypothetical protein
MCSDGKTAPTLPPDDQRALAGLGVVHDRNVPQIVEFPQWNRPPTYGKYAPMKNSSHTTGERRSGSRITHHASRIKSKI